MKNAYNQMRFCTLDASKCMRFHTKTQKCGCYYGDRSISMLVLHVFRDSECDAGGGWVKNGAFSVT